MNNVVKKHVLNVCKDVGCMDAREFSRHMTGLGFRVVRVMRGVTGDDERKMWHYDADLATTEDADIIMDKIRRFVYSDAFRWLGSWCVHVHFPCGRTLKFSVYGQTGKPLAAMLDRNLTFPDN